MNGGCLWFSTLPLKVEFRMEAENENLPKAGSSPFLGGDFKTNLMAGQPTPP